MNESKFTGRMLGLIGVRIVSFLMTLFTIGLAFPWAVCYKQRWLIKNQYIEGQRLVFRGTGAQLFGNYIKWLLLSLITFGIYGLWLPIKIQQWVSKHTHFYSEKDEWKMIEEANKEKSNMKEGDVKEEIIAKILWIVVAILILLLNVSFELMFIIRFQQLTGVILFAISLAFYILLGLYLFKNKTKGLLIAVIILSAIKIIGIDFMIALRIKQELGYMMVILRNISTNLNINATFTLIFNIVGFVNLILYVIAVAYSFLSLKQKIET